MNRRLMSLAVLAAGAWLAMTGLASAGSYSILACDGGPNRSWLPAASEGMHASPAPTSCSGGLTARHNLGPEGHKVGSGSAAGFALKAPPGTTISTVQFDGKFATRGKQWQAALSTGRKILAGCRTGTGDCTSNLADTLLFPPPNTDLLYTEAHCPKGPCNASRIADDATEGAYVLAKLRSASVSIDDPTPPTLANGRGTAWTSDWMGGLRSVTFDADDGSGIVRVSTLLDGADVNQRTRKCSNYAYTCRQWPGAMLDVDLRRISDGPHGLSVTATDRAGNVSRADLPINVDNNPPTPPTGVVTNVARGWTSSPVVRLGWTNPAQQFAPIAGATIQACPAGQRTGCTVRDFPGPNISAADFELPGEGAWDVDIWLRDAAGNSTPAQASLPVRIGLDRTPPRDVAFLPLNRDNPSVLRVRAADDLSGIAAGKIQIRRRKSRGWRGIATRVVAGGLSAQLPDSRLRKGPYRLRARVVDVAGNERSTGRSVSGARASVRLPVRVAARMRVGRVKKRRVKGSGSKRRLKTVYVRRPVVKPGRKSRVGGRLVAPGGNPLANVSVDVSIRVDQPGLKFRPAATLRTDRRGRFSYRLPPGRSRVVRFSYHGAPKIRPQQRTVLVRVRASTSIKVDRSKVVNGDSVRFRGRVRTGPQPAEGKLVEMQYRSRSTWKTFDTVRARAANGKWSYDYRFTETRGTIKYRFRARLPRESGYSYAVGVSRVVGVTVRGL